MRAYGSDRFRIREDGAAILTCRTAKQGWQARIEKTLTTPQHPGTAILWEEEYWEVVDIEVLQSGVRYTLTSWPDSSAMRFVDSYDEVREVERAAERRRAIVREKGRRAAVALGFLTGHLPANVQMHLAENIGINPVRLTMISAIPPFVAFAACFVTIVGNVLPSLERRYVPPPVVVALLAYLAVDSLIRFLFAMARGRPMGSIFGVIGYAIYYGLARDRSKLARPFAPERGSSVRTTDLTADMKLQSNLAFVEPLFSFLDPADQNRLAEKYGLNYRQTATTMATIVMVFSLLGAVTSVGSAMQLHLSGFVSLVAAGWLFVEQIVRLTKFQRGPAGSVLGFVLRPFLMRYLA
jgi:hypothetical protein